MKITVKKKIFVLFVLSFFVVGCSWGKLPPPPDETDNTPNAGGSTDQGYVEPMYPLGDAGIFLKDDLPVLNDEKKPETESIDKSIDKKIDKKIDESIDKKINNDTNSPQPPTTTPTTNDNNNDNNENKTTNSVTLFNDNGQSELYLRTGNIGGLQLVIDDLVSQVDEYISRIGDNLNDLKTSENYVTDGDSVYRDASGLAIVILMVGLSDKDSRYRRAAPELLAKVKRLIEAKDYKTATAEFDAIKTALKSEGDPSKLKLEKVVKLKPVMKAMPNLNSNVRRLTNTETKLKRQLDRKPKQIFGQLAALAAISEGSIPNGDETLKPTELSKWRSECERFRDVAIKANLAAHDFAKGNIKYENYWATFSELSRACDSCHNSFYPDKKISTEE
jgi:hypothetical protein